MAGGKFSKREIKELKENKYVVDVNETRVIYSNQFKQHFMAEYNSGKKPTAIFREAGFDSAVLGPKRIERAAARWRKSYAAGTLGKNEIYDKKWED